MATEPEQQTTPGPWAWFDGELHSAARYQRFLDWRDGPETPGKYNEGYIGAPDPIVQTDSGAYGPRDADRALIAAAPDLLAACRAAGDAIFASGLAKRYQRLDAALALLAFAIAKAEGVEPARQPAHEVAGGQTR